nr:Ppx/GppA phosphatase family protein [Stappia albiluteola]
MADSPDRAPCQSTAELRPDAIQPRRGKKRRRPNRAERRAVQFAPASEVDSDLLSSKFPKALPVNACEMQAKRPGRHANGFDRAPDPAGARQQADARSTPPAPYVHRDRADRPHSRAEADCDKRGPLYAALDLGTNNCRLLVARPEQRGFRVVDAFSKIVRLGEGLGRSSKLADDAMDRAVDALNCCRDKLVQRGVDRFRLIATEACRAAENGPDFIDRVREETGLSLEIVSRETEARLAVAGCASLVDPEADGVVLFDIGGGSSEIVWLDLRNRCGARGYQLTKFIRAWISLPVGVVSLAERHGGRHVTRDAFEAMVADAAEHLQAFALGEQLTQAICGGRVHMLGTSGTVTTLAGVHFGLKRYDRRRVDGAWLEHEDVSAMIDRLRAMPYEERVDNPCIGADRADLVLAGCAILEAIRRRWTCQRLRVADRGLREGILMELMASDGVWRRSGPGNWRNRPRGR